MSTTDTKSTDRAELMRQFLARARDQQLSFLARACNAYAAGIKPAMRADEVTA